MLTPGSGEDRCEECSPDGAPTVSREKGDLISSLEELKSTKSGHILKKDAVEWLKSLDRPNQVELKRSILPKPVGFRGSTHETDISNIRISGDARFIETFAGLLTPLLDFENGETRVELKLERTKVRDTKQYTGNYALYLSVAERGS
jgi:hypothetical protein